MKQIFVFAVSLLAIHFSLSAQQEIISVASDFIVAKKYASANQFLDSVLKRHPKNIDALMMKGNVILNHDLDTAVSMKFITERDESVFYQTISEKPKPLYDKSVKLVEFYWRKCLALDSMRNDIRKGLCSMYAMALLKEKLKKEIAELLKHEKDIDGEQVFRIAEYARKFKERNRFADAMELYSYIANFFPGVAGIRCDIAEEYFYAGKMNDAVNWLDSTYNFKTVDETSFLNGAFTYSQIGYFDNAQSVLNTYSHIYQRKMDQFYYGLRLFSDASDKCFEVLQQFLEAVDSNSYFTEVAVAKKILACHDSFTLKEYKDFVADKSIPDYYMVLIHAGAIKRFGYSCEPYFFYGLYEASSKNYGAAVQFLKDADSCNSQTQDLWTLIYGYSLFSTDKNESLYYFAKLYSSKNSFYQQAAKYFSVKILMPMKRDEEAKKLRDEIISSSENTKYKTIVLDGLISNKN